MEEPTIDEAYEVLLGVKPYYEGYHGVSVPDTIVKKRLRFPKDILTTVFNR